MVHKEKKTKFLILISKYKYKSKVDLDYYYFITNSLKYSNYKYLPIEFDKNNKIINLKKIGSFLKKKSIIILAEANIEYNYLYSNTLINLIKKSGHTVISFFGDIDKIQIKSKFIKFSDFVFIFDKFYAGWCNENIQKNKFHYLHSFPIVRYSNSSFFNFKKRRYDFSYLGSPKNFRINFINSFLNFFGKRYITFVNYMNNKAVLFNRYSSYFKILLNTKFYFCTRAGLYENHPSNKFSYIQGRYSGRVSEAIAAGCIPVYWQPKKPNNILGKFFLKSRFSKFKFLNSFFMGDKNSRPYDVFDENYKDMIIIVSSPKDLNDQISNLTENQIKKKLYLLNSFYYKFISPNAFFKKLFSLV